MKDESRFAEVDELMNLLVVRRKSKYNLQERLFDDRRRREGRVVWEMIQVTLSYRFWPSTSCN